MIDPLRMCREGENVILSIELPFTERPDIDLTRNSDELFIGVGPHRRNLILPDSLRRREIRSAALVDGRLDVVFATPSPDSCHRTGHDGGDG